MRYIINLGKWELRNQGICFFSGRNAPHIFEEREDIENMTNETFLQKVEQYGGIPEEFYIKEIMDMFLPILRADFIILDNYKFQPKAEKISCGISVLERSPRLYC